MSEISYAPRKVIILPQGVRFVVYSFEHPKALVRKYGLLSRDERAKIAIS